MESTTQTQVQLIPLNQIRSNPDNPRSLITDEMVAQLAANIQEVGLLNPIKVLSDPRAPGAGYINLSGEIRYRAFAKLGREAIPAYVLNLNPEDAFLTAYLDNRKQDMGWWADYRSVEGLLKANPSLTQRQVAAKLELDLEKVSRAVQLLPLLNPESRALIDRSAINSKQGVWTLSDRAAFRLAALGPKSTLKPGLKKKGAPGAFDPGVFWPFTPVPPEIQNLVNKCLSVVIERHLTESGVKKLVEWVKIGNEPASFSQKPKGSPQSAVNSRQQNEAGAASANDSGLGSKDPYAAQWEGLPPEVTVTRTPKGYRLVMELSPAEVVPVVYGAMSNWEHLKGMAGEDHDLRYRNALHQAHKDAVPLLKQERKLGIRSEELGVNGKNREGSSQSAVDGRQIAELQKPGEGPLSGTEVASSSTPAYSAGTSRNDNGKQKPEVAARAGSQPQVGRPGIEAEAASANDSKENGFLGKIGDFVQQKTGLTAEDLKAKAETMLAKDAKQAVNYEIRKGMRNILKDLF